MNESINGSAGSAGTVRLYHDIPKSRGVENALKRARQMLDIRWVPVKKFPSGILVDPEAGTRADTWLRANRPQKGLPYSSVRIYEKYVGFNVSFETFMTALSNPNSVLYTRPQHGAGKGMYSYYGVVCSSFVSYVCAFPYRMSGTRMLAEEGFSFVDIGHLENLELCDILLKKGFHVAVITDIQRDVDGKVRVITVSESTAPVCISLDYTPEQFRRYWLDDGYVTYRYEGVHKQTYEPTPYAPVEGDPPPALPPVNTAFMSNYGDKANIRMEETVEFSVFEDCWKTIEVTAPDGTVTTLPIVGAEAAYSPKVTGFHSAVCRNGEQISQAVHFCVTDSSVKTAVETVKSSGTLEIRFCNAEPDPVLLYVINNGDSSERQRDYFTQEEILAGKATITAKLDPGDYYIYTVSRNAYGYYVSNHCPLRVQ